MTARVTVFPRVPQKETRVSDTFLSVATCALLLFGPLAFGATESWSVFILRSGAAALFVFWWATRIEQRPNGLTSNPACWSLVAFAVIVLAQIVLGSSAYRQASIAELLNYVTYGMIFLIAADALGQEEGQKRFVQFVIVFGFLLAVFAVLQDLSGTDRLYWLRLPTYRRRFFGPYVNENHYAGLMEMLLPFAVITAMRRSFSPALRSLAAFSALMMAGSVVLSRSRTGTVLVLAELMFLVVFCMPPDRRLRTGIIAAVCSACFLAVFVAWLGVGPAIRRFTGITSASDFSAPMRFHILLDAGKLIRQRPVLGWGAGTFPYVYPAFRSFQTDLWVNQAHNDILQVLIETGVLGFACILLFAGVIIRKGVEQLRRSPGLHGAVALGALVGIVAILCHSFIDFNLHIPANAAWFFFLCGVLARGEIGSPDLEKNHWVVHRRGC